jgi:hypothetical protein
LSLSKEVGPEAFGALARAGPATKRVTNKAKVKRNKFFIFPSFLDWAYILA